MTSGTLITVDSVNVFSHFQYQAITGTNYDQLCHREHSLREFKKKMIITSIIFHAPKVKSPVIWETMTPTRRHYFDLFENGR